jgi:hypothetical protein
MFSGLPPEADVDRGDQHVSKVPKVEVPISEVGLICSIYSMPVAGFGFPSVALAILCPGPLKGFWS